MKPSTFAGAKQLERKVNNSKWLYLLEGRCCIKALWYFARFQTSERFSTNNKKYFAGKETERKKRNAFITQNYKTEVLFDTEPLTNLSRYADLISKLGLANTKKIARYGRLQFVKIVYSLPTVTTSCAHVTTALNTRPKNARTTTQKAFVGLAG